MALSSWLSLRGRASDIGWKAADSMEFAAFSVIKNEH